MLEVEGGLLSDGTVFSEFHTVFGGVLGLWYVFLLFFLSFGSVVSSRSPGIPRRYFLDLFVARVKRLVVHSWEMSTCDVFLGVAE